MKSLFLKLYNLQRKILSDAERKKFFKNKNSKIHPSFKLGGNNFLDISDTAEITIHENVYINESNHITIKRNGKFIIGKNSYLTRGTFSCLDRVEIGENCLLGEGMKLFDHNHQYSTNPFVVHKTDFNTAPIKIGNNVWSGANCVILKGVTIGDNVILGAGCIIHKDVPANSIVMNKQELIIKKLQND